MNSQIPKGRISNMEHTEQQRPTKKLDPSPIQMGVNKHRATTSLPLLSRSEDRQKRISSIGWLFFSMIHDFRNPLATVLAGAEMLMKLDPASNQVTRVAGNMYRAASCMNDLLEDLAEAGLETRRYFEICKIRDVIAAASETALPKAETLSVSISNDVPDGLDAPLERSRMERLFFNLITNALEAMPHGGRIRISARKQDNCVLIDVEDTGPGIPTEIRDRLFEPFVTAGKDHGLGLGLALSRQTVRDHGGDMWTEPASGARFVICLPVNRMFTSGFNGTRSSEGEVPGKPLLYSEPQLVAQSTGAPRL